MNKSEDIPAPAVRRLSLYLRQLEVFHALGKRTVSSRQLGETLQLSDAQVRKDLAYFGNFGRRGIGYRVPELIQRVRQILGTDKLAQVIVVGAGNLGRALIAFRGFARHGFEVAAAYDTDASKIGHVVPHSDGIVIQPMKNLSSAIRSHSIRLGILAVPAANAQEAADAMVAAGIRGILNFAAVRLRVDARVAVSSVDIGVHLEQLSFQLGSGNA